MNKRSIIFLFLVSVLFSLNANQVYAVNAIPQKSTDITVSVEDDDCIETDIIKKVSFRDKLRRTPEAQINNFFKKYNKYSTKNDIEKLKTMYTDNYVNNDGFNKETVFEMMEMAAEAYEKVDYNTDIINIKTDGNYAVVQVHETASGQTAKVIERINDTGFICSDIYYTDYLVKENNKWLISATYVTSEKVDLKYGEAKKMKMAISAPDIVPAGSEYEASLKTVVPDGVFAVGSIVNEQIVYPQVQEKDVFRSVKQDELARVLKANKDKHNEYATASIAITRAQVEPSSVVLSMTGMAFVMKRVNVLSVDDDLIVKKEDFNATKTEKSKKSEK